jgi:hypothetical protein
VRSTQKKREQRHFGIMTMTLRSNTKRGTSRISAKGVTNRTNSAKQLLRPKGKRNNARKKIGSGRGSSKAQTASASQLYKYQRLKPNEIRLLELPLGTDDEELHCRFYTASSNDPDLRFLALSYVWGSDQKTHVLKTQDGDIPITTSLHSALTHIRRLADPFKGVLRTIEGCSGPFLPRFWVGAVCINQEDNVEKSQQVQDMDEIFGKAERVIVFLDQGSKSSDLAIRTLRRVAKPVSEEQEVALSINPAAFVDASLSLHESKRLFSATELRALCSFFDLPWFSRLWTVQEVVIARYASFVCGSKLEDVTLLYHGFLTLIIKHYYFLREIICQEWVEKSGDSTIVHIRGGWHFWELCRCLYQGGNRFPSSTLLDILSGRQTTKARDQIFGLLALTESHFRAEIRPDYEEPIETVVQPVFSIVQPTAGWGLAEWGWVV